MLAERLSDLALDPIARHRFAGNPPRDRYSESCDRGVAGNRRNGEVCVAGAVPTTARGEKFRRASQTVSARQTQVAAAVVYTLSRRRPLARRALITARPPTVRMRARKP